MTRLLVTGGCGFIGSNFLHEWRAGHPDDELVNLDLLTYAGNRENVRDLESSRHYRWVQGDIADADAADRAMDAADVVVHFAAESHVDRSVQDARAFLRSNIEGTWVLLEAARKHDVKRFHHVSTDEVYGQLPLDANAKFRPDSAYRPRSPYAASKAASDHLVRAWGATYGLPYSITNGSNNYGPYQFPEKVIPRFITNLLEGQKLPVYGTGKNVRDWLHVTDYCRAIDLVLERGRPGETYLVGADEELDNLSLARAIAREFDQGDEAIEFVRDRPGHDLRYALDSTKIRTELGWRPRWNFSQGLKATVQWYRDHEAWWRPLKRRSEAIYR